MQDGNLSDRRVLVTGGSGFLGRHMCVRLVQDGATVSATYHREAVPPVPGVEWLQADLADRTDAARVMRDRSPEVVFNLAGRANAGRDPSLVYPTLMSDTLVTVNLLLAATETPVARIVTTTSLEEPDPGETPTSPYAAAKLASTAYARMFHELYSVPVVLVRPFMTYGPGQSPRKLVPYLLRTLSAGEVPDLGDGSRLVDWIYVDDVIEGCIQAAVAPGTEGMTFDLGSGTLASIRDVAEVAVRLTGARQHPRFGASQSRGRERVRVADVGPARKHLGWCPDTDLETGLEKTLASMRKPSSIGAGSA